MKNLHQELAKQPYSWPGGYPRFAITDDGGALCVHCVRDEVEMIEDATPGSGWQVVAISINWENSDLLCDHCGEAIESAYGDDSEESESWGLESRLKEYAKQPAPDPAKVPASCWRLPKKEL